MAEIMEMSQKNSTLNDRKHYMMILLKLNSLPEGTFQRKS
jgi:hypothetical protein